MTEQIMHACAVQVNGCGILIQGNSGSGKTSTMLRLIEQSRLKNMDAHLISDDQVYLENSDNMLVASPPTTIAGQVEIRGFGISEFDYIEKSPVHLITQLIEDKNIERMPELASITVEGIILPLLHLPQKHEALATRIVFAWLKANR